MARVGGDEARGERVAVIVMDRDGAVIPCDDGTVLHFTSLGGLFGARVTGVDLSHTLHPSVIAALEQDALRSNRLARFNQLQSQLAGLLPDGHRLLIDAGQRNFQELVVENISTAHDRYILRNAESRVQHRGNRAIGGRVVIAKNPVGPRLELKQRLRGLVAGAIADFLDVSNIKDELRIDGQSEFP